MATMQIQSGDPALHSDIPADLAAGATLADCWRKNAIQRITCSRLNLSIGKEDWRLRRLIKNRAEARHVVVLVIADGRTLKHRPSEAEIERQTRRHFPIILEVHLIGI